MEQLTHMATIVRTTPEIHLGAAATTPTPSSQEKCAALVEVVPLEAQAEALQAEALASSVNPLVQHVKALLLHAFPAMEPTTPYTYIRTHV